MKNPIHFAMIQRADLTAPVIVVGMHRSGTAMLTRILLSLGIHMGWQLSENAESRFFQDLNRKLLTDAGGSWFDIEMAMEKMQAAEFVQYHASELEVQLFEKGEIAAFLGMRQWLDLLLVRNSFRWGWKDPRSSITLPIWLSIFPSAKVVHVIRNGIDVAVSLHRREKARRAADRDYTSKTQSFSYCFMLWEQYVKFCREHSRSIPKVRYAEIRYEEVLRSPVQQIRRLMSFLNLGVRSAKLAEAVSMVDPDRLDNKEYRQDYQRQIGKLPSSALMAQLKYS